MQAFSTTEIALTHKKIENKQHISCGTVPATERAS